MSKNTFTLDKRSIALLKNFLTINPSLEFLKGKDIRTVSSTHSLFASGELGTTVPKDFVINELDKFINYISMIENHVIELNDHYLTIRDEDSRQRFVCHYGKRDLMIAPEKDEEPELPSCDVKFDLKKEDLETLLKAINIVGVTDIQISSAGKNVTITGINERDTSSDSYSFDIKPSKAKNLKCSIKVDDLKILVEDYTVEISEQGVARFSGKDKLQYYIGVGV